MARDFKKQLAGQVGESLVVAELGRRGVVATSFAGNVPDIDVVAYANGSTCHIQVKSFRANSLHSDAKRFIQIEFDGDRQHVRGLDETLDGTLIYVFVKIGESAGGDRFFILEQKDLQAHVFNEYSAWLEKCNGVRPKNPKTTHTAIHLPFLSIFENNWAIIEKRLKVEGV